jgi:hypothetical protein
MKNIALRFICVSFLFAPIFGTSSQAFAEDAKIIVGYFSNENQENFEKKVKPFFDEYKGRCKSCEISNLTPYDEKGVYNEKALIEKIKNLPADIHFVLFSWNKRVSDQNKELVSLLGEKVESGKLVIAPTGIAAEGEAGVALSRTVMGQAKDVIIIGDTLERERLSPQSYFGPEMLSAIKAPKDYVGQGYSPLYFAARLASVWNKRKPNEWLEHFKTKKMKSRKIWLDADDLLGR